MCRVLAVEAVRGRRRIGVHQAGEGARDTYRCLLRVVSLEDGRLRGGEWRGSLQQCQLQRFPEV